MASLNLGRLFHSPASRNQRRQPHKPTRSSSLVSNKFKRAYTSVMIVPTGVGAAIGGYARDALPVARALSSVVDCLISHPNVLNAAMLYWPMPNILYVEGYALDRFAQGLGHTNRFIRISQVGLVLDAGLEEELRIRHLQVVDATRASLGLPVVEHTATDTALQVEKWVEPKSGKSTGRIKHLDSLLRAAGTLVERCGVNAIAVVARLPDDDNDDDLENYRQGKGIDLLAGVEAVISHLVVQKFGIPCAHAPALLPFPLSSSLCPKSAAEEPLLIAIEENETVLGDTPDKLGIPAVRVSNYWEAIGVAAAHKAGIDPNYLRKNQIHNIKDTSFVPSNGYVL